MAVDGKIAVNISETTNMVHWIDTATRELMVKSIKVGRYPWGVVIKP